jgi:hypothetical protein
MPWHAGRCSFAGKVEATFEKWRNLVFPLDTARHRSTLHPPLQEEAVLGEQASGQ